jgi:protein O-mannosyl-transferase
MPATVAHSGPAVAGGDSLQMGLGRVPAWLVAALLAIVSVVLYWPATGYGFVSYDDPVYVTENVHVRAGLTWEGLAWAFGRVHGEATYWHPVTWISHMIDCQLYGLQPWGHHLTSVLLHAVNAVLLFLVFRMMTGALWRSAAVAALFALHPLQVDSVAWITERKNLLSVLFWLLSVWAYARYVRVLSREGSSGVVPGKATAPTPDTPFLTHAAARFYVLSLFCFALGLMCKPVLVTLPFVLLLLDYWPLERMNAGCRTRIAEGGRSVPFSVRRCSILLLEKAPFLVLAAGSSLITLLAHRAIGGLHSISSLPWDMRIGNALVSYVRYVGKTLWPSHLSVFYPYPAAWPVAEVIACGLLLVAASVLAFATARKRPWWFVGWFWFIGVMVPSIGLVQAGEQAMADRFMYVPAIGLFLALVWGVHGMATDSERLRVALGLASLSAVILCVVLSRRQLGYWKNSEALFQHAVAVTESNYVARIHFGTALAERGQYDEAIGHFQEALRLKPANANAHMSLGIAFSQKGQLDDAIAEFRRVIRLKADYADAHYNLGTALGRKGRLGEAAGEFQTAIRLNPNHAEAQYNLGVACEKQGNLDEGITRFREAVRLRPGYAQAHNRLGSALHRKGLDEEAVQHFQHALQLRPDFAEARKNLDAVLARMRQDSKQADSSPVP